MRCTRCDGIAVPQAVGRTRDGVLVFGWCLACLGEEGCLIEEPPGRRRRWRWQWPARGAGSRRLAVLGVAGLLAAWALVLTFLGVLKVPGPVQDPPRPIDGGSGWFFLGGGGLMALVSLAAWAAVLDRATRLRFALKVVQVASATVAVSALGWALLRQAATRVPLAVPVAAVALGLSWAARRYERRRVPAARASHTAAY